MTCLNHYYHKDDPCPYCAEDAARGYEVKMLAGRCASGEERGHGTKWHALKDGRALCGAQPGRRSAGWSSYTKLGQDATCPKCLKKLGK